MNLLPIITDAARQAGDYLRQVRRPDADSWARKGPSDFVTQVDRTAEEIIRELLLRAEPGSRVVGEELSPGLVSEGLVWVVDPLDGTTNFLHGFPPYAVSIAAAVEGRLEAGVILDVPRNRMYYAGRGGGAWRDGDRIHVSTISDPAHALIGTGVPFSDLSRLDEYLDQFRRVVQATAGIRRPGSAAIDLATVAEGGFEGFWEQRLSAWDIAAGTLLVREAGGLVTDFTGRDLGIEHGEVLAGNREIHAWLGEQVGGER